MILNLQQEYHCGSITIFCAIIRTLFSDFRNALGGLQRPIRNSLRELIASRSFIFFSGVLNLILALPSSFLHSHWSWHWSVGVTILGYVVLFHGIIRCAFVDHVQRFAADMLRNRHWVLLIVLFVLGAFFTYHGFKG